MGIMVKLSCTVNVQYGVFCFNEAWLNSVNEQFNSHCKLGLKAPELIHFKLHTKTGLKIRVGNSLIGFSSNLLVKKSESLPSLCSHERFAHSCSFVKSVMSELLQSLFKKERLSEEQCEQFAHGCSFFMCDESQSLTVHL